ncbi:MAG: hypothetical protein Q8L07_08665 [Sediminibacterium sp.]|nr:hypothetical protein [Sediminibacterium sp.]
MNLLLIAILAATIAYGYYWFFTKKPQPAFATPKQVSFEGLVPAATTEEMELSFEDQWEETNPELIEDDETVLLVEAEKLINDIESVVRTNQDVYLRLTQLLSGYNLFYNTEYHDAINRFIAVVLKRDCNLELSETELAALWQ